MNTNKEYALIITQDVSDGNYSISAYDILDTDKPSSYKILSYPPVGSVGGTMGNIVHDLIFGGYYNNVSPEFVKFYDDKLRAGAIPKRSEEDLRKLIKKAMEPGTHPTHFDAIVYIGGRIKEAYIAGQVYDLADMVSEIKEFIENAPSEKKECMVIFKSIPFTSRQPMPSYEKDVDPVSIRLKIEELNKVHPRDTLNDVLKGTTDQILKIWHEDVGIHMYDPNDIQNFFENFKEAYLNSEYAKPLNVRRFEDVCDEMIEQYERKNSDYGDSASTTFDEEGMVAYRVRLTDKLNRFKTLTKGKDQKVHDESIRDTLMDMATYSIMAIMDMDTAQEKSQNHVQNKNEEDHDE